MPLFASFSAIAARGLGITSGIAPGAPNISDTTATATTIVVDFTPVVGSYEIDYFEYSLNGGAYTGSIEGNLTQFTISSLTPGTSYSITMRAVDVTGQVGAVSNSASDTTSAEVANSAPVVTLTQLESTGTPINATRLSWSFAASTGGTYAVSFYQYRLYRGVTEITSGWTTTPMGPTTTFTLTGLLHNAEHTVQVRAVSATSGLTGTAGSATATTDQDIANGAPTITVDSVTTSSATFTRTTSSGGTYSVASYEWRTKNSSGTVVNSGTMTTAETSKTIAVGVNPDAYFTIEVRAISATSGTAGSYGVSDSTQLNPGVPTVGTLSWAASMTTTSWGTANLTMAIPTFATSATLVVPGVGSYAATTSSGNFVWSVSGFAHNETYTFYAYVTNRISQNSGNSNTRTWVTPKKNQLYSEKPQGTAETWLAATNSAVSPCNPSFFGITYSGIPSSDNEVGYKRVDYYGIQMKTGGFSNTNTLYLYWTDPVGTKTSSLSPNTDATYSLRYEYLGVGGSSLNGTIQINFIYEASPSQAGSASRNGGAVCTPQGNNWFYVKEFYVEGVQTTAGSLA